MNAPGCKHERTSVQERMHLGAKAMAVAWILEPTRVQERLDLERGITAPRHGHDCTWIRASRHLDTSPDAPGCKREYIWMRTWLHPGAGRMNWPLRTYGRPALTTRSNIAGVKTLPRSWMATRSNTSFHSRFSASLRS